MTRPTPLLRGSPRSRRCAQAARRGVAAFALWCTAAAAPAAPTVSRQAPRIPIDREWQVLRPPRGGAGAALPYRRLFRQAGRRLGSWSFFLDELEINGATLLRLADEAPGEPFVRVVREGLRQPVDVDDFVLFLDDLLRAGAKGLRGQLVWLPAGRARKAGILLHPDDVFEKDRPRRYAEGDSTLAIDRPARQASLPQAPDGAPLGPEWCSRYPNPRGWRAKMDALARLNPSGTFHTRVGSLLAQLRQQGVGVGLYSSVRSRERGYLMWGAFLLSHAESRKDLNRALVRLDLRNREWGLNVPIRWRRPGGWRATREAARLMASSYNVVYATELGAKRSSHYDGTAVDIGGLALPRALSLEAPDGERQTFDLSDPAQSRDLNLSPDLIDWIEAHFTMHKLRSDYPHWEDATPREDAGVAEDR